MQRLLISVLLLCATFLVPPANAADTGKPVTPAGATDAAKPAAPPAGAAATTQAPKAQAGVADTAKTPPAKGADILDPKLRDKAKRAADDGLHYLREHQAENGSWSNSVGVTALALRAFLEEHRAYNESDGPFITRAVRFILDHANEDGSISETKTQNGNYNTAAAITALQATHNPAYADVIKKGQNYLKKLQADEGEGYPPDHKFYGGIGYGGSERPDLNNTYFALEALKATSLDPNDPVWKKAQVFVNRCQNRTESNDQKWAANDGGYTYRPGDSPQGGTNSYGGATHMGLISLLFAGVDKQDPRIQAAHDWIRANYTLDDNPGAQDGKQGLFYYYNAFGKSMYAYGEPEITDSKGVTHNWRNDLVTKLLSLQADDGSWVNTYSSRWWENDKNLVTAWSVIALNFALR
jgi:squalene-hopene/tetraprenyl-beta-curcumene cyclase